MANKKAKKKNNKNNATNRSPVGSTPPDIENKDLIDIPAPDPAAGAVEDVVQVCSNPRVHISARHPSIPDI
jgi:hypothetical protein